MHQELRKEPIEKIVIHVNVGPEVEGGAVGLSHYLESIQAGYHRIADDKTFIVKAKDNMVVWGASYMNNRALHLCLIGQANQSAAQWADAYSKGELNVAAGVAAEWCMTYSIPVRHLTTAQVAANGVKGLCGHIDVTNAFKAQHPELDHWDPGPNFPWNNFLHLINVYMTPVIPEQGDSEMFTIIDTKHPGKNPTRPRAAAVTSDGKIMLGNGAKLNTGKPKVVMGLTIVDPGYVTGEKYVGSTPSGNGWMQMSILPNGEWGTRGYQFVE